MEINKVLQSGRERLLKNGIDPREARLLLAYVLNIKKEELIRVTSKSFGFNKITEKMMTRFEYVYLLLDESKNQE